jgi:hypothetical protein
VRESHGEDGFGEGRRVERLFVGGVGEEGFSKHGPFRLNFESEIGILATNREE